MPKRTNLSKDGIYHIIQKAAGNEDLFYGEHDKLHFIHLLKEMCKKYGVKVIAFVLMSNHIHILIKTNDFELSHPLKFLFQSYAQYYNAIYRKQGCVYKGRFYSECVRDHLYLLISSLYIHLNPIKANICNNVYDYRWSSIRTFNLSVGNTFIQTDLIFNIIDSKNSDRARNIYNILLREASKINLNLLIDDKYAVEEFFQSFMFKGYKRHLLVDNKYKYLLRYYSDIERIFDEIASLKSIKTVAEHESAMKIIEYLKSNKYSMLRIAKKLNKSRMTITRISKQNCYKNVRDANVTI